MTLAGPTLGGPVLGGPVLGGPTLAGPTQGGPTLAGPTLGGPALGGPVLGGAALGAPSWAAIVLAGGRATRMSGIDKIRAEVGDEAVLARVVRACDGHRLVVVGPPELAAALPPRTALVQEDPPHAGPVAALRAGLSILARSTLPDGSTVPDSTADPNSSADRGSTADQDSTADRAASRSLGDDFERVAVLAGDQPGLDRRALDALADLLGTTGADAAVLIDDSGRQQYLCAVWHTAALVSALPLAGTSMRSLYAAARVVTLPDRWGASLDIDTPDDLAAARARLAWPGPSDTGPEDTGPDERRPLS